MHAAPSKRVGSRLTSALLIFALAFVLGYFTHAVTHTGSASVRPAATASQHPARHASATSPVHAAPVKHPPVHAQPAKVSPAVAHEKHLDHVAHLHVLHVKHVLHVLHLDHVRSLE